MTYDLKNDTDELPQILTPRDARRAGLASVHISPNAHGYVDNIRVRRGDDSKTWPVEPPIKLAPGDTARIVFTDGVPRLSVTRAPTAETQISIVMGGPTATEPSLVVSVKDENGNELVPQPSERPTCCWRARTCAELRRMSGRDVMPQSPTDCYAIIVDRVPDSPSGMDLEWGRVDFCPFCGAKLETP